MVGSGSPPPLTTSANAATTTPTTGSMGIYHPTQQQVRGKKTKSRMKLEDLPRGVPLIDEVEEVEPVEEEEDEQEEQEVVGEEEMEMEVEEEAEGKKKKKKTAKAKAKTSTKKPRTKKTPMRVDEVEPVEEEEVEDLEEQEVSQEDMETEETKPKKPKRNAKAKTSSTRKPRTMRVADLPQGRVEIPPSLLGTEGEGEGEDGEEPAYPTVVLQAHRNMRRFENCVLLTRVGGFYELYLHQAEEYGPLLNLKVAQKRTSAGPVPMSGFPFFQLDRFLKTLVVDLNCYVAIAEEFPNSAGDRIKANGLMHDRRVTRVITPGTLIDENFIDPYANNYVMAIHVSPRQKDEEKGEGEEATANDGDNETISTNIDIGPLATLQSNAAAATASTAAATPIGVAWIDVSTGQFYTQATTVTSLQTVLSRVAPREVVVDKILESQRDEHKLFSVLAEDKHLITFAAPGEHLPLSAWTPMLESEVAAPQSFTADEVAAGSLLLQYIRDRLQGLSMRLQPPLRYENMSVMSIDKSTMRALEIKQTIRDAGFRGSLLHAVRRTVTKGGARLLHNWLSAPSTSLKTITSRQDLVEHFIQRPDLRDEIVTLLRRSHDSQRLVQKFALGRGDPDDFIALANTIRATQRIVARLEETEAETGGAAAGCFAPLLSRIQLQSPVELANRIKSSIDEDGLVQQQQNEDDAASQLMTLAENVVVSEGEDPSSMLPKSISSKKKRQTPSTRDYYTSDDNAPFVMKPEASEGLRARHTKLSALLREKLSLAETLRERFGAASLTLRWTPTLGHVCHVKGTKDLRRLTEIEVASVSSSRSTRTFHLTEWTALGRQILQTRYEIGAEEQRIFADLRASVVANLVKLRRNAAVLDELDVAASFARLAAEQGWIRPILLDSAAATTSPPPSDPSSSSSTTTNTTVTTTSTPTTVIIGGRHPTVEAGLHEQGRSFTKNDCILGNHTSSDASSPTHGTLRLITGPNMGGKSTYLRQNALIAVLAQAGSYVPADYAALSIADAVYSRVGSADNLYSDQSTFMVEMLETAAILRSATSRSLVIMDEIGRGTTPEDGTAVAFAALHHLVTVNKCRALFATHFHSLADLVEERSMLIAQGGAVEMYCTDVEEDGLGSFVYVHRLREGINRESHALKVARLANLPEIAITVAREILERNGKRHSQTL